MQELLQELFKQGPKEPDIEITYDPERIKDETLYVEQLMIRGRRRAAFIFIPILLAMGLTGLAFDLEWLSHLGATVMLCGLLANIGINGVSLAQLKAREAAGDFDGVADIVFVAGSGYWYHRELEKNIRVSGLQLALSIIMLAGTFLVTWYFVMAVVALSILSDIYAAETVDKKGKGLVEYKQRWDEFQAKKQKAAAEVKRKHDDAVREILGEEEVHLDEEDYAGAQETSIEAEMPEPNTLDKDGAFYDPDVVTEPAIKYEDDDGTIREG